MVLRVSVARCGAVVLGVIAVTMVAGAAQLPVQGQLRSAGGAAVDGSYDLTFRLFAQETGGTQLWSEVHLNVPVKNGIFSRVLGAETDVPQSSFDAAVWLELQVEGEPALERQLIRPTPVALTSQNVSCSGCITPAHTSFLAGCSDGQVLKKQAGTWGCGDADSAALAANSEKLEGKTLAEITAEILAVVEEEGTIGGPLSQEQMPPNGLNEVSNNLLSNQFVDTAASKAAVPIPDDNANGVSDVIDFPDVGVAESLTVSVNLTNSDMSTITVTLTDPKGISYLLYNQDGPGTEFATTYPAPTPTQTGDLTSWIGQNPAGAWTLKVVDDGFKDNTLDGQINSWSISIQTLSSKKVALKGNLIIDGAIQGTGGLSVAGNLDLGGNMLKGARLELAAEPPVVCNASTLGYIYLDTDEQVIKVCIDDEFQAVASGVCGDGKIQGAEECDDGDALNGDGCNAACQMEAGWNCTSSPSVCAAPNCAAIKAGNPSAGDSTYLLDPNGGDPSDAFTTFCNMSSPHGAPDFKLVTPPEFYHGDNSTKYGSTNGVNVFGYSCDACSSAKNWYSYPCPDEHWEVAYYNIRSHCNHSNHKSDTVFTSETYSAGGGVQGIRYRQISDDCGDPNEFTIVGACRIKGVSTPAPTDAVWDGHYRNVSWSN